MSSRDRLQSHGEGCRLGNRNLRYLPLRLMTTLPNGAVKPARPHGPNSGPIYRSDVPQPCTGAQAVGRCRPRTITANSLSGLHVVPSEGGSIVPL